MLYEVITVEDFAKKLGKADTAIINKKLAELKPMTSGYPRYTEGARYWLQWAGVPDSIYSRTKGKNDYSDDFQSRGFWVNYISGGSSVVITSYSIHYTKLYDNCIC